jgi:hypothetical protein
VDNDEKPLGSITAQGAKYTLGADWKWSGPDSTLVEMLDAAFNPKAVIGPCDAVAPRGYAVIESAAKWAKDDAPQLPRLPESEPGAVH